MISSSSIIFPIIRSSIIPGTWKLCKKECALAHSRAEARLPQQPSTLAPSAHPREAFLSYGNEVSYTIKKNPAKQDSPPAAGRASDILPFRCSAFYCHETIAPGNREPKSSAAGGILLSQRHIQHHHQYKSDRKSNRSQIRMLALRGFRNQLFYDNIEHRARRK